MQKKKKKKKAPRKKRRYRRGTVMRPKFYLRSDDPVSDCVLGMMFDTKKQCLHIGGAKKYRLNIETLLTEIGKWEWFEVKWKEDGSRVVGTVECTVDQWIWFNRQVRRDYMMAATRSFRRLLH